ncbi:MAG TPA: crotonase/enoyl-CoA hydratase family protein [Acidimicrobiales bacterium]|jgi:enoyl-CoA hydratase
MSEVVTTAIEGVVAVITVDDGKANAISLEVADGLAEALTAAAGNDAVRAVVLAGREGRFSAGFHLPTMQSDRMMELLGKGGHIAFQMFAYPKPLVLAVTGHALAMGAVMLMAADEQIGARGDFKIGLNEVRIGLALPPFASRLARYRLDPRHMNSATQLAEIYSPDRAVEVGFLTRVVDLDQVVKEATARAAELAEVLDPGAFLASREFIRGPISAELGEMVGAANPSER